VCGKCQILLFESDGITKLPNIGLLLLLQTRKNFSPTRGLPVLGRRKWLGIPEKIEKLKKAEACYGSEEH
jgi:hypothetical protein